jgi:pyruvate ferredoxin oxidoreductase gamma subunit
MAQETLEIRWHGRGGQGAKTAATFLAEAAMVAGKHSQGFPEYGPERRGAPVRGYTRISDNPIRRHCGVASPDVVVVLDPSLLDSPTAGVTQGTDKETIFLVNTTMSAAEIKAKLNVPGAFFGAVDASGIAKEEFGRPIPNTPMVGALMKAKEIMSLDEICDCLTVKFGKKFSQAMITGNLRAVRRAHEELQSV